MSVNSILVRPGKQVDGLIQFQFLFFVLQKCVGRMVLNSGSPYNQALRTVPTERRGRNEPCPEGEFDLGPLEMCLS